MEGKPTGLGRHPRGRRTVCGTFVFPPHPLVPKQRVADIHAILCPEHEFCHAGFPRDGMGFFGRGQAPWWRERGGIEALVMRTPRFVLDSEILAVRTMPLGFDMLDDPEDTPLGGEAPCDVVPGGRVGKA
jgi:hypothetical protein